MERGKLQTLPGCHCVQILEEIIQPQTIFQMLAMPALQSKVFSPKCRNLSLEAKYLHCCKKTKQAVNYFRTKAQWITSVFKYDATANLVSHHSIAADLCGARHPVWHRKTKYKRIVSLHFINTAIQVYYVTARTAVVLTDSFVPNAWLKEIISPSVQFYQPVLTQQMFYNCTYNSGEKQSLEWESKRTAAGFNLRSLGHSDL